MIYTRNCEQCGEPFQTLVVHQRFCNASHKAKFHRQQRDEYLLAKNPILTIDQMKRENVPAEKAEDNRGDEKKPVAVLTFRKQKEFQVLATITGNKGYYEIRVKSNELARIQELTASGYVQESV